MHGKGWPNDHVGPKEEPFRKGNDFLMPKGRCGGSQAVRQSSIVHGRDFATGLAVTTRTCIEVRARTGYQALRRLLAPLPVTVALWGEADDGGSVVRCLRCVFVIARSAFGAGWEGRAVVCGPCRCETTSLSECAVSGGGSGDDDESVRQCMFDVCVSMYFQHTASAYKFETICTTYIAFKAYKV